MSIEELTKTQLVLLVLFVSFITSIATGVVTVSLLGETPLPITVTQTVNRVVEHTIEKVIPGQTLVREVPTIVSDEELLMKTISSSFPAIVKIRPTGTDGSPALGFAVSSDGLFVTNAAVVEDRTLPYELLVSGKPPRPLEIVAVNTAKDFALLRLSDTKPGEKFAYIPLEEKVISLAQNVVGQSEDAQGGIALGVITAIKGGGGTTTPTETTIHFAERKPAIGSPILTYRGGVVGMWGANAGIIFTADLRNAVRGVAEKKPE